MAGNFWERDKGESGTTTTYTVSMTESVSYEMPSEVYLTRINVDSAIASGQTLTLSLVSGGVWLQSVFVVNESTTESITVTNGSESFTLPPSGRRTYYIDDGVLWQSSNICTEEAETTFTIPETYYQFLPDVAITKNNANQVRAVVRWEGVPKSSATSITMSSNAYALVDGTGTSVLLSTVNYITSISRITDKYVIFYIDDDDSADSFDTLGSSPISLQVAGSGDLFTLS